MRWSAAVLLCAALRHQTSYGDAVRAYHLRSSAHVAPHRQCDGKSGESSRVAEEHE